MIFRVPFEGSLFVLYVCLTIFIFSIVGVGLFISSLCSTQQQAILGTFTFMVPAITLSGFATPIENMPDWLQYITYANPVRYILIVNKGIFLKNMPLSDVALTIWPLFIIAAITLSGAALFFRRGLA
jgi:ABC-2 type transport system permease protein